MLAIQPASSCVTLSNLLQQLPTSESRHAIYFTPPETSVWCRFGCEWLGRDAITGAPAPRRRSVVGALVPEVLADVPDDEPTHRRTVAHAFAKIVVGIQRD